MSNKKRRNKAVEKTRLENQSKSKFDYGHMAMMKPGRVSRHIKHSWKRRD